MLVSIDIDAQKGFSPLCPDELPVDGALDIVAHLNANAALAHKRIMTKDAHPANALWVCKGHAQMNAPLDLPHCDQTWVAHCVVGTKGFDLLDGLPDPMAYDFCVYKGIERHTHPYGACYHDPACHISTGLLEYLSALDTRAVLVGGLATDYCVFETVRQMVGRGFLILLNLKACRGIAQSSTCRALEQMRDMGVLVCEDADNIAQALKERGLLSLD